MANIVTKGSTVQQDIPVTWVDQSDGTWALKTATSVTTATATLAAAIRVGVTGTEGTLIAANSSRKGLTFRSLTSNTQSIFYGPVTVTTTTGMELKPGEIVSFYPGEIPVNLIQAISTSGTQTVIVQEAT